MNRAVGRNMYVVDIHLLANKFGVDGLVERCRKGKITSLWIRIGRGAQLDPNWTSTLWSQLRVDLALANVNTWGWHVPFCADEDAAEIEAALVLKWADDYSLSGVVLDAEITPESPRFRGHSAEAFTYSSIVSKGLVAKGRGVALSSHDQPAVHVGFPFQEFLFNVQDNCPQVYYHGTEVAHRLALSISEYQQLEVTRNFTDRYKPTANITMGVDNGLPDVNTCVNSAKVFITLVKQNNFSGYSFWCWDEAPDEIWDLLEATSV